MKVFFKITILVLAIVATCCISKRNESSLTFQVSDFLVSKTVSVPVNSLLPFKVFITGDFLVIYDQQKTDLFKVFALPSIKFLFSWGEVGRGPGEFYLINSSSIIGFKDRFVFQDHQRVLTATVDKNSILVTDDQMLKQQNEPINGLLRINDSCFIFDRSSADDFEHTFINLKDDSKTFNFGEFNDPYNIDEYYIREQVYTKTKAVKPDGRRIAVFYLFINKFKLYDENLKIIKEVFIGGDNHFANFSISDLISKQMYNAEVVVNDSLIYVLNPNISLAELRENKETLKPTITVWNWDGEPIAKYQLDKPVCSFALSNNNRKIYAISTFVMNEIYEYELPGFR